MRLIREIELDGVKPSGEAIKVTVVVKELTVGEIRGWLKSSGLVSGDVIDCTLFEEFSLPDLYVLSSLKAADVDLLPPSEICRLEAVAKEVNADFFEMRSRVVALGRQALAAS